MPFERVDTTMAEFALCADCRSEYERPGDRRFHAQTIACEACGPHIWATAGNGGEKRRDEDALRAAVANLSAGKIVALRGLGGYQLLVDATNQAAVERLRERKGRRAKPLAVMVESLEVARRLAHIDQNEAAAFEDPSAPIVLLRSHSKNGLAPAIHPQLNTVGLMRPTTPLHAILRTISAGRLYAPARIVRAIHFSSARKMRKSIWPGSPICGCIIIERLLGRLTTALFA